MFCGTLSADYFAETYCIVDYPPSFNELFVEE